MEYINQDWFSKAFAILKGTDYTYIYSSTKEMDSFKLIIAIASVYKWDLW